MDLAPDDRDAVIRTMLSEAGNQSDVGLAGVAAVIRNRVASGRFGDDPTRVVMARNQFEPWSLPRSNQNHPLQWDPKSPQYQRAGAIADAVFTGSIEDLTGGATHFFSPKDQAALGRKAPSWAQGQPSAMIGDHAFYAPEGRAAAASGSGALGSIDMAIGARPGTAGPALGFADDIKPGSVLGRFGFGADGEPASAKPPASAPTGDQPAAIEPGSVLKRFGHDISAPAQPTPPAATPIAAVSGPSSVPMSGPNGFYPKPDAAAGPPAAAPAWAQNALLERGYTGLRDLPGNALSWGAALPGKYGTDVTGAYQGARALAESGLQDIRGGALMPTFPGVDPATWTGGGILKTAGGIIGQPLSPLSGAFATGGRELENVTGLPRGTGETILSTLPITKGLSIGRQILPSVRATNALVSSIGPENLPSVISRLESNPRLAPMDVSPSVRTMAQGLAADPANPAAQGILNDAYKARQAGQKGAVVSAYDETLGARPDVLATVDAIKQRAVDAGKKEIEPAIAKAGPVNVTPVIRAIDDAIAADPVGAATLKALKAGEQPSMGLSDYQSRLFQLRQQLRGTWADRDEMFLDASGEQGAHSVQASLRAEAQNLLNSSSGADRNLGYKLMGMRNKIVDAVDEASGGAYKPALGKYRDAMQIDEAFTKGLNVNRIRQGEAGLEDRPEFWAREKAAQSPDEIQATQHGILTAIDQKVNSMRHAARGGMDIPDVGFTRDKLELYFGKPQTDALMQKLADAKDVAATDSALFQGSKTASTIMGRNALKVREIDPLFKSASTFLPPAIAEIASTYAGMPGMGAGPLLALGLAKKAYQKLGQRSDIARDTAFARWASATGQDRNALLAALRARQEPIGQGNKLTNALAPFLPALPR